ncbi:Serine/threonine-protein phosphatase [Rhynchospora pubera]|uniref:Serine/threonine-protein phosphatase n=1 Tax=Rhynchospora pubera TaxID=906938 RepID=A0AAV8FBU8_9POAL|nr:Serine/threonine-protein phosphatase [Rhynchospora pubera]
MSKLIQKTPTDCFRTTLHCIYFWIVTIYCPNRTMRQFGRYQDITDVPKNWEDVKKYFYQKRCDDDMAVLHEDFCERWLKLNEGDEDKVVETRPWTDKNLIEYLHWFREHMMVNLILNDVESKKPSSKQRYIPQELVMNSYVSRA